MKKLLLFILIFPLCLQAQFLDVRDFGASETATPNTNRLAIEAAVNSSQATNGATILLTGMFTVNRNPGIGNNELGAILIQDKHNIEFVGFGNNTGITLEAGYYPTDTHVFFCFLSTNITFRNFRINGNRGNHTLANEQMHGIMLRSCSEILIDNMVFDQLRGDGVSMFGNPSYGEYIKITNSKFSTNGRSGIAMHSLVRFVDIIGNRFKDSNDQSIDTEPGNGNQFITIRNNVVDHTGSGEGGDIGVALSQGYNINFSDNVLINARLRASDLIDCKITNNNVSSRINSSGPTFEYFQNGSGLLVSGNIFRNNSTITGMRPFYAYKQGGNITSALFEKNIYYQVAGSSVGPVKFENCYGIDFINETIIGGINDAVGTALDLTFNLSTATLVKSNFTVDGMKAINCNRGVIVTWYHAAYKLRSMTLKNIELVEQRAIPKVVVVVQMSGTDTGTDRYIEELMISDNTSSVNLLNPVSVGNPLKYYKESSGRFAKYVCNQNPEGLITAGYGSECWDQINLVRYKKNTTTGNTGWIIN